MKTFKFTYAWRFGVMHEYCITAPDLETAWREFEDSYAEALGGYPPVDLRSIVIVSEVLLIRP